MNEDRIASEAIFLGAVLYDNSTLAACRVTAEMFTKYQPLAKKIWELSAKMTVTPESLWPYQAEVNAVHIAEVTERVSFWNWEHYQEIIFTRWAEDQAKAAFRVALTEGYPQCWDTVERVMTAVMLRHTGNRTKTIGDVLVPTMERIMERHKAKGKIPGISFGMSTIDSSTLGAQPGQLIVIGARPSEGKSALASQLIRTMSREVKVGVFMIESDEIEYATRTLAGEAGIDSRRLQTGSLTTPDLANLKLAIERIEDRKNNILVHAQPAIKLGQLQTVARRMARDGVKAIFVDYLQLLRITGSRTRFDEVAAASLGLKELALELKVPVVALAQLGRDSENRRPGLADFQYSSQIEQDADQCWLIWHEYGDLGEIKKSTIIIGKARDGVKCDVPVVFKPEVMSFYEVERDRE